MSLHMDEKLIILLRLNALNYLNFSFNETFELRCGTKSYF